jgi:hypothetical protein
VSDVQIPNLPAASSLSGQEQIEVVQDGVSVRASTSQMLDLFTLPLASDVLPSMDGTANAGGSINYARGDHVHPSDTSRYAASNPAGYQTAAQVTATLVPYAKIDSQIFTGTPSLPTGTAAVTQAPGDSSAKIATTAFVAASNTAQNLGTMATQNANSVAITGGAINGTTVGATTASTGAFTTLSATTSANFTTSGTVTINPATLGAMNNVTIGATTPAAGTFTNLTASGTVSGAGFTTLLSTYAKIDSQAFTGTPSLPTGTTGITQATADSTTKLATTAFVKAQGYATTASLGTMSTQNANAVAITGGAIDGTPIGATTRSSGAFTTLAANGAATFTGSLTASPASANVVLSPTGTGVVTIAPATLGTINNMSVGATTPSTGAFTTLVATSINSTPIGATTPSTGAFTTLSATSTATFTGALTASPANASVTLSPTGTGTVTINPATLGNINNMTIGATTAAAGTFTNLTATGTVSGAGFTTLLTPYALVNSQVFTGTPSLPTGTIGVTQAAATNNTTLATTAYVKSQNYLTANQTITLSGDVTGSGAAAIAATVVQLQGRPLSASLPATGNLMGWNGTTWGPVAAGAAAAGGTANQIQYNNGGVLGGIATTGTFAGSSVVMSISPTFANSIVINSAAGGPSLTMSKFTGAFNNMLLGRTNTFNRWNLSLGNSTAETGSSNIGSDFSLDRYDDAGNFIDRPLSIYRTDGHANFSVNATFPAGITAGSSTFNNAFTIAPSGATSAILTLNKSSGSTGVIAAVEGQTVGSRRWLTIMGNGTTEGGSNAGSDFLINRYSDTAVFIDTPFQIIRSTGVATFSKAITSAGVTITSPAATDAILILNKPVATQNNVIYGQKAGAARWGVALGNATAESGSDKGSDFAINNWSDAGAILGTPLQILRTGGYTYLNGNGATLISNTFEVAPYGHTALRMNKAGSGKTNVISGMNNGLSRWNMELGDSTTESAGSGSDFIISRCNDAGTLLDTAFKIARSTAQANFSGAIVTTAGIATLAPPTGDAALYLAKSGSAKTNLVVGQTGAFNRWFMAMGDNTAESGGNAGSNFALSRFNDAGVYIDTPFFINRNDATVGFSSTVTANAFKASGPYALQVTGLEVGSGPTSYTQYPAICNPSYGSMNFYCQHIPGTSVKWVMSIASAGSFAFDGSGNGYAPASWISLSDLRVKTDIKEIKSALEKIGKLTGCTYERTDLHNLDGTRSMHAGLIAQDIQAVLPEAVFEDKTPDGKIFGEDEPGRLSYATNGVVALLVNAVKELTARVEALEAAAAPAPAKTRRSR